MSIGEVFQGVSDSYTIQSPIGAGRGVSVWEAHSFSGEFVALKYSESQDLKRERSILGAIQSPCVIELLDCGSNFIVLPLGVPCDRLAKVDEPTLTKIALQGAIALQAVHRSGYAHRDVKPGNLIARPSGDLMLADFGLASTLDEARNGHRDELGSQYFCAPERLGAFYDSEASGEIDPAISDMYSLGATLFWFATGRPANEDSVNAILNRQSDVVFEPFAKISPTLRYVVERLLKSDPSERLQASEVINIATHSLHSEYKTTRITPRFGSVRFGDYTPVPPKNSGRLGP